MASKWANRLVNTIAPVRLARTRIAAKDPSAKPNGVEDSSPVLIMHGLYGARQNFRSVASALSRVVPWRDIYTLDLANHGESPHRNSPAVDAMAGDVLKFIEEEGFEDGVNLVGHSLGGKVAMTAALARPQIVQRLAVLDMAPVAYKPDEQIRDIGAWMAKHSDLSNFSSREDVVNALNLPGGPTRGDVNMARFLAANVLIDKDTKALSWRINISALTGEDNLDAVRDWPLAGMLSQAYKEQAASQDESEPVPFDKDWDHAVVDSLPVYPGLTVFLRGGNSDYVQERHRPLIDLYFPNSVVATVPDTGHWVHAENPTAVKESLAGLLSAKVVGSGNGSSD